MIAYVSALTNGRCNFRFKEKILNDQASRERSNPVKVVLDLLFKDKVLVSCETAVSHFKSIVDTMGGIGEKNRTKDLLSRILIVPDYVSEATSCLNESCKVKERSKIIFGTGDHLNAVTVTANSGFVRASKGQGFKFSVFIHESRALTEAKELEMEESGLSNKT